MPPVGRAENRLRSNCRVEQHVAPGTVDLLVAAEETLPPITGHFGDVN